MVVERARDGDSAPQPQPFDSEPTENNLSQLISIVVWDGLLSIGAAVAMIVIRATLKAGHPLEVIAILLIPMIIALIRAGIAHRQLARACSEVPSLPRQVVFALAISLLFLFEICAGVLTRVPNAPVEWWAIVALLYVAYFACIAWALRPAAVDFRDQWANG